VLCFAQNNPKQKDNFGPRNRKCVFLGYPFGKKGWKVYNLETQEILISRDMMFNEGKFSFTKAMIHENASMTTVITKHYPIVLLMLMGLGWRNLA